MRWKARVVASLLPLVAAGCGTATPSAELGGVPPASEAPASFEASCPPETGEGPLVPDGAAPTGEGVPADFVTSWVLRCRTDARDLPGQGTWMVRIAERADTSAPELVDQLRRPSEPRSNGACTLELVVPPYFALVDSAGAAIRPAIPTDGCGKPRAEALKALEALPFRTLSETPVTQVRSQQSLDTGCSESWKDMLVIGADSAAPGPARPLWSTPVSAVRVCVYDTSRGGEPEVGQFVSGRTVAGDAAKALLTVLDQAGPATPCTASHTRFAVLTVDGAADWPTVELDGCHRLLRPDNTLGQLDDAISATLTG